MGVTYRTRVPVPTEHGVYLGWRYNVDGTPKSTRPYCGHVGDRFQCEQWAPCQDPEGPDFYMTLPGHWKNERCDKFSNNNYYCHHKPKADEVGPTTFCAVPRGDPPDSSRGRCVTVDVRP